MSTIVLRSDGRVYEVDLNPARDVVGARVYISAHDKEETWRRVKHPVTMARLQALIRPPAKCPHCGAAAA